MARLKPIHKGLKLLPADFDRQVIPGSRFDYALCHLVDSALDLSAFHARYKNDLEGASAFVPSCRAASTLKPVFGNLRGKAKVDGQWKWYCLNWVFIMGFFYSVVSCVCLRWGFLRAPQMRPAVLQWPVLDKLFSIPHRACRRCAHGPIRSLG